MLIVRLFRGDKEFFRGENMVEVIALILASQLVAGLIFYVGFKWGQHYQLNQQVNQLGVIAANELNSHLNQHNAEHSHEINLEEIN